MTACPLGVDASDEGARPRLLPTQRCSDKWGNAAGVVAQFRRAATARCGSRGYRRPVTTLRGLVRIPLGPIQPGRCHLGSHVAMLDDAGQGLSAAEQVAGPVLRFAVDPPFLPNALRPATSPEVQPAVGKDDALMFRQRPSRCATPGSDICQRAMSSIDLTEWSRPPLICATIVEAVIAESI